MESEPFLNPPNLSDSQTKHKVAIGICLGTGLYALISIILLIVYAFESDLVVPNLMMAVLVLFQLVFVAFLYRLWSAEDTYDRLNAIFIIAVCVLLVASTVGIFYAVAAQGVVEPLECTGLYYDPTAQCFPLCRGMALMNTTIFSDGSLFGECQLCDYDEMLGD